jgi:hypothetical protein
MASYVITVEATSFSCVFLDSSFSRGYHSKCGEFVVQGQAATDRKDISLIGEAGSFSTTTFDVSYNNFRNYSLNAGKTGFFLGVPTPNTEWDLGATLWDGGASFWDGINVNYEENVNWGRADIALTGSFNVDAPEILSGKNWYFPAEDPLEFTLVGQDAALARHIVSYAETAQFNLVGQEALLEKGLNFLPEEGSFVVTGVVGGASFIRDYVILATNASFEVSVEDLKVGRTRFATVDTAVFEVDGQEAELDPRIGLEAVGADPFFVYGFPVDLIVRRNYFLQAESATINLEDTGGTALKQVYVIAPEANHFDLTASDALLSRHIVAHIEDQAEYLIEIPCPEQKVRPQVGSFALEGADANFHIGSRTTTLSADSAGEFNVVLGTITTFNYNWENQGEFTVTGGDAEAICTVARATSIWDNGNTEWDNTYSLWDPVSDVVQKVLNKFSGVTYEATFYDVAGVLERAPDWFVKPIIDESSAWADEGLFEVKSASETYGLIRDGVTGKVSAVLPDPVYLKNIKMSSEPAEFRVIVSHNCDSGPTNFTIEGGSANAIVRRNGVYEETRRDPMPGDSGSFVIQGAEISLYYEPSSPPVTPSNVIVLSIGTGRFDTSDELIEYNSDKLLITDCK